MNGRILLAFGLLVWTAAAGAKSYDLTLLGNDTIGSVQLKPGTYRLDLGDGTAVIHYGRQTAEVPVKVETNGSRYGETTVRVEVSGGVHRVTEIHLGGTKTRLMVGESSVGSAQD